MFALSMSLLLRTWRTEEPVFFIVVGVSQGIVPNNTYPKGAFPKADYS